MLACTHTFHERNETDGRQLFKTLAVRGLGTLHWKPCSATTISDVFLSCPCLPREIHHQFTSYSSTAPLQTPLSTGDLIVSLFKVIRGHMEMKNTIQNYEVLMHNAFLSCQLLAQLSDEQNHRNAYSLILPVFLHPCRLLL